MKTNSMLQTLIPDHPQAIVTDDWADCIRLHEPGITVCVVERSPSPLVVAFCDALLQHTDELEVAQPVSFGHFDFACLLPACGHLLGHDAWCQDVEHLTAFFCDLLGIGEVGLRLRTLHKAMCPRFHVDHVPCRLITAYAGSGSEWLPDSAVDRSLLGHAAKGLADEVSGLIRPGHAIQRISTHAIALFKGSRWEGNETHGLVHRSPTPEPGQCRLLMTLDML
jgi:hypothetical protein